MDAIIPSVARERDMAERGRRRAEAVIAKAEKRGDLAETPAGTKLVQKAIGPMTKALQEFVDAAATGGAGRRHTSARMLEGVDLELAAYIATVSAIQGAAKRVTLKAASFAIARALETELLADAFEAKNKALYTAVVRGAKGKGLTAKRIAKAVELANKHFEVAPVVWTDNERANLGTKLIELLVETLGIVAVKLTVTGKNRQNYFLEFGEGIAEWYAAHNSASTFTRPMWLPTLASPKPWTTVRGGAYETDAIRAPAIVSKPFKGQMTFLKDADMGPVYGGLNGIQETPWRVNARVLAVMREAWEKSLPFPAIPSLNDEPLPAKPEDIETNEEARKKYRQEARAVHQGNAQRRSDRFTFARLIDIAAENAPHEAIYFPHRLDFRGRCYAMSTSLNPQGPDESRALLHFAEGKAIGERGKGWLGIHGANLFGNDKVSLRERYLWAVVNWPKVAAVAADPLANLWWTEADKPWSFLAWCFEWEAVRSWGADYVSHLPIALDGSCNGIQHYSAMLRDEVGGAAVNLVPSEKPQDIYQAVADRVKDKLAAIVPTLDHPEHFFAYGWHQFGIDRKTTKRAVMVLPYGGTFKSCLDYVSEAVNERIKGGQENPFGDELRKAQGYLAKLVWESIGDVVIAARAAMKWLQAVARLCSKAGVPIRWTTPTGFVAVQDYRETDGRRIATRFLGSVLKYRSTTETDRIDADRQASALPPNVVHSLDAAAMMRTIEAAKAEGIKAFAMIHDSYGTHAATTERFSQILRESFVAMYEADFLGRFRDEVAAQLPAEYAAQMPPLPQKGSLDLSGVLRSAYFFA